MACIKSPINSNLTSLSNAPISEMRTYPLMPKVEGKMYEKYFHTAGVTIILLRCAGFNNVDLQAAKECGITVLRVPAYSPYAVAEHAMAILQEANRRLHKHTKVKDNNFALSGLLGLDLHNKVAGIMGTGKIGQCMARICKGYGMTVLGWDTYPNQALVDERFINLCK